MKYLNNSEVDWVIYNYGFNINFFFDNYIMLSGKHLTKYQFSLHRLRKL